MTVIKGILDARILSLIRQESFFALVKGAGLVVLVTVCFSLAFVTLASGLASGFRSIPPPSSGLTSVDVAVTYLLASLLMPLFETVIFQAGFIWLIYRRKVSYILGAFLSAVIFAIAHFDRSTYWYAASVFFLGLIWVSVGVWRARTLGVLQGSLATFLCHAMHNAVVTTLSIFQS